MRNELIVTGPGAATILLLRIVAPLLRTKPRWKKGDKTLTQKITFSLIWTFFFLGEKTELYVKTKFGMNSLIDLRMCLSTFELANPDLRSREMGLTCICLLEDPVMAAIAHYLPTSYRYSVRDEDISAALAARAELLIRDPASLNQTWSDSTSQRDPSGKGTGEVIPGQSWVSPETKIPGEDATPPHDANQTSSSPLCLTGWVAHLSRGRDPLVYV